MSVCLLVCSSVCSPLYLTVCIFVHLSACLFTCLPLCSSVCLPLCIYLFACLSICLHAFSFVCWSAKLSIYPFIHPPIWLSVNQSTSLSLFRPSIHPSNSLCACSFVNQSVSLFSHLSYCQSVYKFVSLFVYAHVQLFAHS
jgi:hypothetical protein